MVLQAVIGQMTDQYIDQSVATAESAVARKTSGGRKKGARVTEDVIRAPFCLPGCATNISLPE